MNFESMGGGSKLSPMEQQLFAAFKKNNPEATEEQFLAGRAEALNKANAKPQGFENVGGVMMQEHASGDELAEMAEDQRSIGSRE